MTRDEAGGLAFDIGSAFLGPAGMALSPSQLGDSTLRKRDRPRRPGESVLQGSTLPPEMRAHGGLVHLAGGGQPGFGEARAYEPSYSERIRDYAAKHIGRDQANRLFAGPNARFEDNFNPVSLALQTPGAIADAASGFMKAGREGDYLGGMGNYLMGAANVAPLVKPAGKAAKTAVRELGPKAAEIVENYLAKTGGIQYAVPPGAQTVTDPLRNAFPGVYKRPDVIAQEAAARVAPESPALKQLFGVTRDDLYQMGKGRVGNMPGVLPGAAANPKGSKAAANVMNPRNEQRLLDVLRESEKYPELVRGMDPWYIMDPAYKRLEQLVGPEEAVKRYKQLNTLTGMASPGSDVLTEMNRGTAANYLATQGRFSDFVDYAGKPMSARGADFPQDLRAVMGHPYHKTAQATPMQQYLDTGTVQMSSPKVPAYIQASSVPEVGFQTDLPVGDAHWSRAVGLADTRGAATRKGQSVIPGASVSNPEMSMLAPWWKDKIAGQVGLESVPAQARAWGAFSPQTGVESPIGAPKLELLSMKIMEAANRYGVSPEQARDMILKGEGYAGKKEGGAIKKFEAGDGLISYLAGGGKVPEAVVKAYKLFRTKGGNTDELYPLFVNANKPVPLNEWVNAEVGPVAASGKVKSKLGELAYRPGWHAGDLPIATHIGGKSAPGLKAPDFRRPDEVWAEVEMPADVNWQEIANQRARLNKTGKPIASTAHITDQIPEGGFYRYKTSPNMKGNWLIGGGMKVNKVLTDEEVMAINEAAGVADLPRFTKFNE